MIHANQNLDDLIEQIGQHNYLDIEISFPPDFKDSFPHDEYNINVVVMDAMDSSPGSSFVRSFLPWSNWPLKIIEAIDKTYGALNPGANRVEKMRKNISTYKLHPDECPEEELEYRVGTQRIPQVLSTPNCPEQSYFLMESFRQEFSAYISEALKNAVGHGNGFDLGKKAQIQVYLGENGILITVTDEGNGFDVKNMLSVVETGERYTSKPPERHGGLGSFWFHNAIFKSRTDLSKYHFGYNDKGNQWIYLTMFDDDTFIPTHFKQEI